MGSGQFRFASQGGAVLTTRRFYIKMVQSAFPVVNQRLSHAISGLSYGSFFYYANKMSEERGTLLHVYVFIIYLLFIIIQFCLTFLFSKIVFHLFIYFLTYV